MGLSTNTMHIIPLLIAVRTPLNPFHIYTSHLTSYLCPPHLHLPSLPLIPHTTTTPLNDPSTGRGSPRRRAHAMVVVGRHCYGRPPVDLQYIYICGSVLASA
jgi:hypothetical protein